MIKGQNKPWHLFKTDELPLLFDCKHHCPENGGSFSLDRRTNFDIFGPDFNNITSMVSSYSYQSCQDIIFIMISTR